MPADMAEHIVCSDERYHLHDAGRPSFKVNGWSVSFLELAFYFGCPGVNAFGGFVTLVHFVGEGTHTNASSTTAMEEEKEYPSVLTLLPKKVHPLSFKSS